MWLNIGLCGGTVETVKWLESYLSDRRQCVKVNDLKSSLMPSQTGRASGINCRADIICSLHQRSQHLLQERMI